MRKFFFFTMLLIIGVALDVCAQSTVLDEKLQFASSESALPAGWDFVNCSLVKSDTKWFVQVNESGSVTTPALSSLTGNANVIMLISPTSDSYEFNISVDGDGEFDRSTSAYVKGGWQRFVPYFLVGGNSSSRITFSGHDFKICNVMVIDIGDAVYYESFNRCDGKYGDENGFNNETKEFTNAKFDNPLASFDAEFVMAGDSCLYVADKGYFYTAGMQESETKCYVLNLKVAGLRDKSTLNVEYMPVGSSTYSAKSAILLQYQSWNEQNILLSDVNAAAGLKFSGSLSFLDEVLVYEVKNLSLDEASESALLPSSQLNKTVFAQLTRTFQSGIWNTCCLPFRFSASLLKTATGEDDLEVSLRKLSGISNDGIFTFASADVIPAGEPFLLSVSKTVKDPLFRNVVIERVEPKEMTDPAASGYAFRGCFGQTELATDGTNVFIGTDRQLHTPSASGNVMKGLRAYMVLPEKDAARGLVFNEETTGISVFQQQSVKQTASDALFNLNGQRVQSSRPGIYIKGGKKIIIK